MFKMKIYSVGKIKEHWLDQAISLYRERMQTSLSIEEIYVKNDSDLIKLLDKESRFISLTPEGKMLSSEEFAKNFFKELEEGGSRLIFVIGGANGLPSSIKERSSALLSLSKLTFTHQITRLILIEQTYRALEIAKGTGYHK